MAKSVAFMAGRENLLVAFTYLAQIIPFAGLVVAILVYLARRDEFVRFNAVQAFIASAFFTFLIFFFAALKFPALLFSIVSVAVFIVFAFAAFKSYSKQSVVFPLVNAVAK